MTVRGASVEPQGCFCIVDVEMSSGCPPGGVKEATEDRNLELIL